jgi:hypothetical protein
MATLEELCTSGIGVLEELKRAADEERRLERERWLEQHRSVRIFDSYEDALQYLRDNPDKYIEWHVKTLHYLPELDLFESFEQDYGIDGVIPYDVIVKYSAEQLLSGVYDFLEEKGYSIDELKDERGKLEYVYTID